MHPVLRKPKKRRYLVIVKNIQLSSFENGIHESLEWENYGFTFWASNIEQCEFQYRSQLSRELNEVTGLWVQEHELVSITPDYR